MNTNVIQSKMNDKGDESAILHSSDNATVAEETLQQTQPQHSLKDATRATTTPTTATANDNCNSSCVESVIKPATMSTGPKLNESNLTALTREDFDGGPVSLDEIEPGLFLGNLTAATHMETLKSFKITHILTLDTVPLPQHIVEASFLTTKYIQIADMPREDILHHLEQCVDFIAQALSEACNVLVHCYFGVSRSSSVVIAYIMKRHHVDYAAAYELVRAKRRFVQPNAGFIAQLKLYRRMGCKIEPKYQKYKLYCLRMAGEQMRKAKILPQIFHNLIKPDPGITQANPEPLVYRCRRCRRVLAHKSHVLDHLPRLLPSAILGGAETHINNAAARSSTATQTNAKASVVSTAASTASAASTATAPSQPPRLLEQIAEQIRKASLNDAQVAVGNPTATNADGTLNYCRSILFVEPIVWMQHIMHNTQGRLNCPKCEQKVGNFSWINGCQCPCGETMTPAFYLIPSKVELSKTVQNVQTTV